MERSQLCAKASVGLGKEQHLGEQDCGGFKVLGPETLEKRSLFTKVGRSKEEATATGSHRSDF